MVCKSGTDFREFSVLKIFPGVRSSARLPPDPVDFDNLPPNTLVPGDVSGGAYVMPRYLFIVI